MHARSASLMLLSRYAHKPSDRIGGVAIVGRALPGDEPLYSGAGAWVEGRYATALYPLAGANETGPTVV